MKMVKCVNLKLPEKGLESDVKPKGKVESAYAYDTWKIIMVHVHIGYLIVVKYCIDYLMKLTLWILWSVLSVSSHD